MRQRFLRDSLDSIQIFMTIVHGWRRGPVAPHVSNLDVLGSSRMALLKPVRSTPFEALTSLQRSVAWSDGDQVAVLTNHGIRIYHPVYRPYAGAGEKTLKVNESFLRPPEKIPRDFSVAPTIDCDAEALIRNMDDPAIVVNLTLDRAAAGPELDPGDFPAQ